MYQEFTMTIPFQYPNTNPTTNSSPSTNRVVGRSRLMTGAIAAVLTMLLTGLVGGCAKNPVTGKNELLLVGEQWELETGKKHYSPLRQSQGGDYVVDPAVQAYVQKVGNSLARHSDRKLPYEFHVINDSTPNAWALPGGKISINRGLLVEMKSEAELAAVLAHEIVHAAAKHGARAQTRGVGLQLFTVGAVVGLGGKIGGQNAQLLGGVGAQLMNQSYSRKAERESDEFGIKYMSRAGYDVQGAVDLQQTFVKMSKGRDRNKFEALFASHPASEARVRDNILTAAKYPKGGKRGVKEYQRALATLTKTKPAYDAFDKARKLLSDGNVNEGVRLINKAISLEPREATFHSALGDVALHKKNYRGAKQNFDKAIKLNRNYFYYFLRRGEINKINKQYAAAKKDLQRSITLLPTADAHALMGDAARLTNDKQGAKASYILAAKSGGATGKSAYSELLKMDLTSNPGDYLGVKTGITERGTLAVQINNSTPEAIAGIEVTFVLKSTGKGMKRRLRAALPAGKSTVLDTGERFSKDRLPDVRAKVTAARLSR